MTLQPDKLFHDKLENFQRPAPQAAWERIENNLDNKHSKGLWMKIAAGLLLLALAAFLLWPGSSAEHTKQLTNAPKTIPQSENIEKQKTIVTTPEAVEQKIIQQQTESKSKKEIKKDAPIQLAEKNNNTTENNITAVIEEKTSPSEMAMIETTSTQKTTSRTIVYTAEEVNAKFLRKKSPDEATPEEKKSSGIQKLMGIAYTLKNTENGFGDLRQKKDEILALSFLSNEDKTNKEKN